MGDWKFDGVNLKDLTDFCEITDISQQPGIEKSANNKYNNSYNNRYNQAFSTGKVSFALWLKAQGAPSLAQRKDVLIELLSKPGLHVLEQTVDERVSRYMTCEVSDLFWCTSPYWLVLGVDVTLPETFWSQPAVTICTINLAPATTKTTAINLNTVPNTQVCITLTGTFANPKISNQTNRTWVSLNYASKGGQKVVVKSDTQAVTSNNLPGNDVLKYGNSLPLLVLSPGSNTISVSCDHVLSGTLKLEFN